MLHPQVQSVGPTPGDRTRVIGYTLKDRSFCVDLESLACIKKILTAATKEQQCYQEMIDVAQENFSQKTVTAAVTVLKESMPKEFCLNASRIEKNLEMVGTYSTQPTHQAGQFNIPLFDLDALRSTVTNRRQSLLISGGTGLGKTSFALAHGTKRAPTRESTPVDASTRCDRPKTPSPQAYPRRRRRTRAHEGL